MCVFAGRTDANRDVGVGQAGNVWEEGGAEFACAEEEDLGYLSSRSCGCHDECGVDVRRSVFLRFQAVVRTDLFSGKAICKIQCKSQAPQLILRRCRMFLFGLLEWWLART